MSAAPSVDELRAIKSPVERAAAITRVARRCGTLSPELYELRRLALAEARTKHSAGAIARLVGLSRARVFHLTRPATPEGIAA
ncbi:hypothetical protein GCM10010170_034420 [Dactylosporangium salmoneum]|uniref:Uncharacterized protein n=1 Tax=Dactylosporangium salmoneum TaxID=53361 RepID=A0ABN3G9R5_9ACTN